MSEVARPVIIRSAVGWQPLNLGELWRYRELAFFLAWRDIKLRYRRTLLGPAWAVLQPALAMLVFTAILGRIPQLTEGDLAYAWYALAGLVPWFAFTSGVQKATDSVPTNAALVSKVYFPRLVLPLAAVASSVPDLLLGSAVLILALAAFGQSLGLHLLLLPLAWSACFAIGLTVGLWAAVFTTRVQDLRHAVPFLLQVWLFITPVIFPVGLLLGRWQAVSSLNPLAAPVQFFRWTTTGHGLPDLISVLVASVFVVIGLPVAAIVFRRLEVNLADEA